MENVQKNIQNIVSQSNRQIRIIKDLINSLEIVRKHVNSQDNSIFKAFRDLQNKTNKFSSNLETSERVLKIFVDISNINIQVEKIIRNILLSRLNILGQSLLRPKK